MLSSGSVQNFYSDKRPKKKYHKYKNFTTAESENSKTVSKTEMSGEKSSNRSINLKDFSEIKVHKKHYNKSSYENSSSEMLTSTASQNQRKLMEDFPALSVTANHEFDDVNLIKNEKKSREVILEGNTSAISKAHPKERFEMQMPANVNINKGIQESASKKASVQPHVNIKKKKRADPVVINLQDILALNKIQKKRKQYNTHTTKGQRLRPKEFLSGNFLDSSNPKRNRGKHREIIKEKLSTFKMTIIKERILKQKLREIAIDKSVENICFNVINKIDFKSEIKTYLNKFYGKRVKNLENKNKMRENIQVRSNNKEKQENLEIKLAEVKEESIGNASDVKGREISQVFSQGEIKFTSKFREYCDNVVTPDLNSAVTELIKELIKLQDRLFSRDPIKAKIKKRHVLGIREVRKYLTLKKVKMVIIAPNLEKLQMEGSVYDSINELKSMATAQNVTYGFALNRYKLGRCTKKNVPVSAFAVLNYEGIEDLYKNAVHKLQEAKNIFFELTKPETVVEKAEKIEDVNSQIISSLISAFRENLKVSKKTESQPD